MLRGLDHIVHAVHDLDAAAEFYRRIGFSVGARNRHPWGTHNYIVQLPGFFVELLTVAEPEKLSGDGIPLLFGHYHREFLRRQEGLSMLVLESADAAQDARDFAAADIATSEALTFERDGAGPGGGKVKVGFSLAFACDEAAPAIGFMTCQQNFSENFWSPSLQRHANGVMAIAGVVLVADNPSDHHIFLSAFTGQRELHSTSMGLRVPTPRGEIQVMDATAFRAQFRVETPDVCGGARLAAVRFAVGDVEATTRTLAQSGVAATSCLGRIAIDAKSAFGATLVFEPEALAGH